MVERVMITLAILAGLGLLWLGWRYSKIKIMRSIQPNLAAIGKPALLYFSADYCAPCRLQQAPIVDSLAHQLGETVMIQKYDVTQHPDLASQYKILTLPATVILDGQGQVRHINYGVTPQIRLEAQLSILTLTPNPSP